MAIHQYSTNATAGLVREGKPVNPKIIESNTNVSSCVIHSSKGGNLAIFQLINDDLQKELKLPRYNAQGSTLPWLTSSILPDYCEITTGIGTAAQKTVLICGTGCMVRRLTQRTRQPRVCYGG